MPEKVPKHNTTKGFIIICSTFVSMKHILGAQTCAGNKELQQMPPPLYKVSPSLCVRRKAIPYEECQFIVHCHSQEGTVTIDVRIGQ